MQYRRAHSHSKQSGVDFFRKSKCDFLRMNCFGQSALGFQNKNITFRLVAPFPPVLTTAILFPRTSTNSKFNDREITFRVNITIFSEEKWLADLRRRREKILGFWGSISKIQSRIWDLRTEREVGWGVGVRILCSLTKSQVFLCLVALCLRRWYFFQEYRFFNKRPQLWTNPRFFRIEFQIIFVIHGKISCSSSFE